ncbi:MAG TPA: MBL fold metallo-hydrolase [Bacillota bacterium]|nr:MBL fold metallo-hydrolase [Bacillota bacterium]HSX36550.1 MBL fold metallo-hydrolase [Patescibacteria group bacterium]
MDVQFYGANCVVLSAKQTRLVIDDNLTELGGKSVAKEGDIAFFTGPHADPTQKARLVIDQPGEYEVAGVSVYGIAARAHIDTEKEKTATIYKIIIDDVKVLVTGHIYPELSDAQLETIGVIDIMLVPVGGNGYTLDGVGALKLIKKVEPKVIIPTHYEDSKLNFTVPQQSLEDALKALGMEPKETLPKLRFKPLEVGDTTQLVVVEKS